MNSSPVQLSLPFFPGGDESRVERDASYAREHPHLEEQLVALMRLVLAEGGKPTVGGAMYRLRERDVMVWDGAKAYYSRIIRAKYADLRPYIRIAKSRLDSREG